MSPDDKQQSTDNVAKHTSMCKYGLKCRYYIICRELTHRKEQVPEYILNHMNKYGHIKIAICQYHNKSIENSKCKHVHIRSDDNTLDESLKGKLCYYDLKCTNPYCKYLHGWSCPYKKKCNNLNCHLIHKYNNDIKVKNDKRMYSISDEYFGNKKKLNIVRKQDKTTKQNKTIQQNKKITK